MSKAVSVDLVGVGLGPFNLGLAALVEPAGVDALFFDRQPGFEWHPGLMLPGTTVQVPFLADLVTMADPTSEYTFLNYLRQRDRLLRFFFREDMHIERKEFQAYCQWVASRLESCRFGHTVTSVVPADAGTWAVAVADPEGCETQFVARHVVLGTGTVPSVPGPAAGCLGPRVLHSADYLEHRDELLGLGSVCVIGSGQSAGEIALDLLEHQGHSGQRIDWFTRSAGFLPMEYSKLGLEHFSPEYTSHFHGLDVESRDRIRAGQDMLYKGLSAATSGAIFEALYSATIEAEDPPFEYRSNCELTHLEPSGSGYELTFQHSEDGGAFTRFADAVVLATGHRQSPLPPGLEEHVELDALGRPVVELDYRLRRRDGQKSTIFVQNAEIHTHGIGAPDLTLGSHRNSVIANAVTDKELYRVPERNVFQSFGAPEAPDARRQR